MSETAQLIRWVRASDGGSFGFVSTHGPAAFKVIPPDAREAEEDWLLSVYLAPTSIFRYGKTEDEAKHMAETWLREFVTALGAVFPGEATQ
jgi:hypothetical protein